MPIRPPRSAGRLIAWTLALAALASTGVLGLYNGTTEWDDVRTPLQQMVTGGVLLYGILGVLAARALLLRRTSAVRWALAWGVVVTFVGATAALAYAGDDATAAGAVAAGLGSAAIAAGVAWAARATTTPHRPASSSAPRSPRPE